MKKVLVFVSAALLNVSLFAQADTDVKIDEYSDAAAYKNSNPDSTGFAQMDGQFPPIAEAKAVVTSGGSLIREYNIESVEWNSAQQRWEIALIGGFEYTFLKVITQVTPIYAPVICTVDSWQGKCIVQMRDLNGNIVKEGFHIHMIY